METQTRLSRHNKFISAENFWKVYIGFCLKAYEFCGQFKAKTILLEEK